MLEYPHINSNIAMLLIVSLIKEVAVRFKMENHLELSALTLSSDKFLRYIMKISN